jgi:hypothetical protein
LRRKAFFLLLALTLLLATPVAIDKTLATTYRNVGLRVGDTAEYTITGEGAWYADRFTLHVTYVEGSHINFSGIYYDGSTVRDASEFSFDVSNLSSNEALDFLVAANLVAGDPILTYGNVTISIKETLSKEVLGHQRDVNYAEDVPLGILPEGDVFVTDQPYGIAMYWDQTTGILVEAHIQTMTGDENWTLVSTNMFTSQDYTAALPPIAGGLAVVASVVIVAIMANRKRPA